MDAIATEVGQVTSVVEEMARKRRKPTQAEAEAALLLDPDRRLGPDGLYDGAPIGAAS